MVLVQVTQRQIHPYTRTYYAINVASKGKKTDGLVDAVRKIALLYKGI